MKYIHHLMVTWNVLLIMNAMIGLFYAFLFIKELSYVYNGHTDH